MEAQSLIASGAVVVFAVQQFKGLIPSRWLPLAAVLFGVLVQVCDHIFTGGVMTAPELWGAALTGAGVGMGAAGAYDLATAGRAPAPVGDPDADHGAECVAVSQDYIHKTRGVDHDVL